MKEKIGKCVKCGKKKKILSREMCGACYERQRLLARETMLGMRGACLGCGKDKVLIGDRKCRRCFYGQLMPLRAIGNRLNRPA